MVQLLVASRQTGRSFSRNCRAPGCRRVDGLICCPRRRRAVRGGPETGATFEENALVKARDAYTATSLPAVADDSGWKSRR